MVRVGQRPKFNELSSFTQFFLKSSQEFTSDCLRCLLFHSILLGRVLIVASRVDENEENVVGKLVRMKNWKLSEFGWKDLCNGSYYIRRLQICLVNVAEKVCYEKMSKNTCGKISNKSIVGEKLLNHAYIFQSE